MNEIISLKVSTLPDITIYNAAQQIQTIQAPATILSERAKRLTKEVNTDNLLSPSSQRAYFWIKDEGESFAFHSDKAVKRREESMKLLQDFGYKTALFKTDQAFVDHVASSAENINFLQISGHGTPRTLGDLVTKGNTIISADPSLSKSEQERPLAFLKEKLADNSVVIFDS